ncbi:MAG: Ig-like domain-containing protein, partial [Eubacteriales bacterium]|nr:Ig-like domain-containing protein [Eubacteriales bacterium]
YHLDGLDYNIWIEFGEGEYRDYIYTTEESVSIPLNDENIKDYEKCQVHWYAVVEGEEENDPPVHDLIKEGRAVVAEDNKSITINGTELLTGDNPLSLGDFIHVYAEVQVGKDVLGSTDWGSDWTLLEVREPSYDYYYPNNAFQRLPGWQIFIEKPLGCWAWDERHPDGEEIRVSVNKVTVEGDEGVFELEEQEDRWVLTAEKMGTATVTIYHSKSDWDSAEVVESREFVVANDYYDVDFEAKSNNLLPGASLEIEAIPLWIQKDGEQDKEMDASDFIIKWEPSEDYSGVLTYKTDGNKIVVSADPSIKEYMECGMTAYLYKPAEDGSEDAEPLMTREFVICIDTTYFEVEAKDVYVEEAGLLKAEDFVSDVWCYQRTEDGENTKHSEMEKFLYEITNLWGDEGTEDIIKLTNNGEIQITAAPAADEEVRSAVVEIKAAKVDESNGATAETFGYAEIILCKHTYEEIVTKEPTCTDEGVKTYRCTKCEFEKEEVLPALGHKEDAGTVTKPATCVAAGELTFKCSVCGEVLRTETIRATGHTFGEYKVVKEATTEEEGLEERQCSVCGYKETRAISKKTPTPMPTQTPAPTQAPAHVHTFGEYRIVKEATVLEEGSEVRTCSVCGETESRAIDKLTPVMEMNAKANSTLKMKVKQKFKGLKVTKMAAGDSVASWKSSNTKILGVSGKANGTCRLTAKKTGKATLTVTLKSGLSQKITIKVQKPTVKTTGISVESKKVTLKKGKKLALKPELKPITSTEKIKYSSSNKKIVTVSKKGVLTAKKKGKATITIQSGRKKVKVKVTVK